MPLAQKVGKIRTAKALIGKVANVNSTSKGAATLSMIASERGELEFVKLLIQYQATVNTKSKNDTTPFTRGGLPEGMKILLPICSIKVLCGSHRN